MQTLQQLRSGELKGVTTLKLSCNLEVFPIEIFELADSLEILDLSNNRLSKLPKNFSDFKKLKIAFFSDNQFTEFPKILSKCPALTMIGFKANKIAYIPEDAFPKKLQWLILTNNCIEEIPKSIGNFLLLQKVAFAGNKLKSLPIEMAHCKNLELLRISANQLTELPEWLLSLPRLAWLAHSGNIYNKSFTATNSLPTISWNELTLEETLGEGASGVISKALWNNGVIKKHVAVKVFKGDVTSDGFPEDEMNACIAADVHPNLVTVLGKIEHHPQQKMGLVLELIPPTFKNLGGAPSFDTCTRDVFKYGTHFTLNTILSIAQSIADSAKHLHSKGIMHGDLYAHNTLIDEDANTVFGDFGAATMYHTLDVNASRFEKLDVRAYGYLLDDLLKHTTEDVKTPIGKTLVDLKEHCLKELITERPSFTEICDVLSTISENR